MSDKVVYSVAENWSANAWINAEKYQSMYSQSIEDPHAFWSEQSNLFLTWQQPWNHLNKADFHTGEASWFVDGKLNVATNCIDRHLKLRQIKSLSFGKVTSRIMIKKSLTQNFMSRYQG